MTTIDLARIAACDTQTARHSDTEARLGKPALSRSERVSVLWWVIPAFAFWVTIIWALQ